MLDASYILHGQADIVQMIGVVRCANGTFERTATFGSSYWLP